MIMVILVLMLYQKYESCYKIGYNTAEKLLQWEQIIKVQFLIVLCCFFRSVVTKVDAGQLLVADRDFNEVR